LVGVLVAQAVWIMAVPPFRGSDEVDHVYRAAGVASGQWHLSQGAAHGRGTLVWVPSDIVAAAQGQCTSLIYVGHDNCHAVVTSGDRSLVATAAGAYDPLFYVVVGTVAKPFHGAGADYAMRAATAVLCSLLLALGVGLMTWAGTGRWTNLGVLAAITPEVLFSGAIPSPNGVEMGLAFVLWAALLASVRQIVGSRTQRRLLVVAAVVTLPLTFVRLLGPLWVLLIVGAVALTVGWRGTWEIVRRQRRVVTLAVGLGVVGIGWWMSWMTIARHTTGVQADVDTKNWWLAFNLPVYTMQMVGAFPFRDEPAPLWVYPLSFFVIVMMLWAAWRRGADARQRRAVLAIAIVSLLVPVVLSLIYMPSLGAVWQGRYELPFVVGVLPLCGLVLDDVGFAPHEGARLMALSCVFLGVAQVASVVHVQQLELARSVSAADTSWFHPPLWGTGLLMVLACGIVSLILRHRAAVVASSA
jgi:MFS family permease